MTCYNIIKERDKGEKEMRYNKVNGNRFYKAIKANMDNNPFVEVKNIEDYNKMVCILAEDELSGLAIDNGDIVSVYNASDRRGELNRLMPIAIQNGGMKLDNFEGKLSEIYARYGFVRVAECSFSKEFAPEGWDFETFGQPNIEFQILKSKVQEVEVKIFDDYDMAGQYRDNAIREEMLQRV